VSAAFLDTNIAVYAADPRYASRAKQAVARNLFLARDCILSTQVLMETFNVLVRKDLMDPEPAHAYVRRLALLPIVQIEREDVLEALELRSVHRVGHWVGLILRAAEKAQAPILYSEDLSHGQTYGSVRVCNPFIEDFLA
jgi:predicted nucleic acid-binding protein